MRLPRTLLARAVLVLAAAGISAFAFYEDRRKLQLSDWVGYLPVLFAAGFWLAVLRGEFSVLYYAGYVVCFFFLAVMVSFIPLLTTTVVDIGEQDAIFVGILGMLLPSPVIWGSPLPYVSKTVGSFSPYASMLLKYFPAFTFDLAMNAALAFLITGAVVKAYTRFRRGFGYVPYTPVVSLIFATTVLFGAWWRPPFAFFVGLVL